MEELIERIIFLFKSFYGPEYSGLIDERMKSLYGIITYDNTLPKKEFDNLEELLEYYKINYKTEIVNKSIPFSKYLVTHGEQGCMPFVVDDKLQIVVEFPNKTEGNHRYDLKLVHELLHVLDEHFIFNDKEKCVTRSGFETTTIRGNYSDDNRKYEFFNEYIHQKIVDEMLLYAVNNRIKLSNSNDEIQRSISENIKSDCEVLYKFYNEYRDEILEAKLTGNIEIFIDKIGKENFEELNDFVINYYNKYPTTEDRIGLKETEEYKNMMMNGYKILNNISMKKNSK